MTVAIETEKQRKKTVNPKNSSTDSRDGEDAGECGIHTQAREATMGSGEANDNGGVARWGEELIEDDKSNSKKVIYEIQGGSEGMRRHS
jgi:hypothetical protein